MDFLFARNMVSNIGWRNMIQPNASPQKKPDVTKLGIASLVYGIVAWGCLIIMPFFLNLFVLYAMGAADSESGGSTLGTLIFLAPLIVCFGLSITLPCIAIVKGIKAIKAFKDNGTNKKWLAWIGIILGILLYLSLITIIGVLVFVRTQIFAPLPSI
jgi:hypothetical protein